MRECISKERELYDDNLVNCVQYLFFINWLGPRSHISQTGVSWDGKPQIACSQLILQRK
jgi:hypothetical protein